jgi:hypothetical protein
MRDMEGQVSAPVDVSVVDHGSIIVLTPVSEAGQAWMDENLHPDAWQWIGPGLALDRRIADYIVQGMEADGLSL